MTKEKLVASRRFAPYRDVLAALLPSDGATVAEAEALVRAFLEREVD